jgi:hypothetical protein
MSTIFERLLEEGTPAITCLDDNKRTLLHIAAESGHKDVRKNQFEAITFFSKICFWSLGGEFASPSPPHRD